MYRIYRKISNLCFRLWSMTAPTLSTRFQHFDTRMFMFYEMDPNFEWRRYAKKQNPYFRKWGFNVSQLDAAYYSKMSGIEADYYVTRSMAVHYIYPYLVRYDFVPAYMDKNIQSKLLGLPDDKIGILMPENIISNSNGIFYDSSGNICKQEKALEILLSYNEDMILKPTVETYGGHGVIKVKQGTSLETFKAAMDKYKYNYTFQNVVVQHPDMAAFNPTSVNTIRIVTYRNFEKKLKVLYAIIRFGGLGAVVDNSCSNGGFTEIQTETGMLKNRKRYNYLQMEVPMLSDNIPAAIPFWEKIRTGALNLHKRLPQMDIIGWDFSVSPDGIPILIEFNPRPGVGFQQGVGPMFSKEDLDEIMHHVSKVRAGYRPYGILQFEDFPERKTVHTKFW